MRTGPSTPTPSSSSTATRCSTRSGRAVRPAIVRGEARVLARRGAASALRRRPRVRAQDERAAQARAVADARARRVEQHAGAPRARRRDLAELKRVPGKPIVAWAGAGLVATLAKLDLVDEYRLIVQPVVLGGGTPLFREGASRRPMRLVRTQQLGRELRYHGCLAPHASLRAYVVKDGRGPPPPRRRSLRGRQRGWRRCGWSHPRRSAARRHANADFDAPG